MVPVVRSVEWSDLFLPDLFSVKECLHGRSATAHLPLMCPVVVKLVYLGVQVGPGDGRLGGVKLGRRPLGVLSTKVCW